MGLFVSPSLSLSLSSPSFPALLLPHRHTHSLSIIFKDTLSPHFCFDIWHPVTVCRDRSLTYCVACFVSDSLRISHTLPLYLSTPSTRSQLFALLKNKPIREDKTTNIPDIRCCDANGARCACLNPPVLCLV